MNELSSLGLILLFALLAGHLVKFLRIPEVTGYILAGVVVGPSVLEWVSHENLAALSVFSARNTCPDGGTALRWVESGGSSIDLSSTTLATPLFRFRTVPGRARRGVCAVRTSSWETEIVSFQHC